MLTPEEDHGHLSRAHDIIGDDDAARCCLAARVLVRWPTFHKKGWTTTTC